MLRILLGSLIFASCAADDGIDTSNVEASSAEVSAMLGLLNDPATTFEVLDEQVKLNARAAKNLIDHRDGTDGIYESADDNSFDTLEEVDDVKYVGAKAISLLIEYAVANGYLVSNSCLPDLDGGTYDGVDFDSELARQTLVLANNATEAQLRDYGLSSRATDGVLDDRPFTTVEALSEVPYLGKSTMEKFAKVASTLPKHPRIISDIDSTLIPSYPLFGEDILEQPSVVGMKRLYDDLMPVSGMIDYVTARTPPLALEAKQWLAQNEFPAGKVEGGRTVYSSSKSKDEKIADMTKIFAIGPFDQFILFGDSRSIDADVCQEMMAKYPARVRGCFIRNVRNISDARVAGLVLHDTTTELAASLYGANLIEESTVTAIASAEGLSATDLLSEARNCQATPANYACEDAAEAFLDCQDDGSLSHHCFSEEGINLGFAKQCCDNNSTLAFCGTLVGCPVLDSWDLCLASTYDFADNDDFAKSTGDDDGQSYCFHEEIWHGLDDCLGCFVDCDESPSLCDEYGDVRYDDGVYEFIFDNCAAELMHWRY